MLTITEAAAPTIPATEHDTDDAINAGYGRCRSCRCNNFSGLSSWCSHIGCAHHFSAHE